MTEREQKRERVRALLEGEGDAIVLRDPANLAWYLGGARVHVVGGMSEPICEVTVTARGDELCTSVIEAPRMAAEELRADGPPVRALPWWEALGPGGGASDRPRQGERDVAAALVAARAALTPPEVERLRALGRDTAAAAGAALTSTTAAESEWALAGRAARELLERGIEPIVLLVAGEERLPRHRHPLPTGAPLGARAMLVVCGRRHGLICSLTRLRAFSPLRHAERATYDALLAVEAVALDATRPRARVGDVVAAIAAAYPANGFAPDEWHQHHQGGPTGYAPRDYLASPASDAIVEAHQAFAWNPSGGGFKVEDTVLTGTDGVEVVSPDPDWPAVTASGRQRPDVLA